MPTSHTAGRMLRRARAQRHLSLSEVSRRSGIAKSTLSLYENGRQQPSVPVLDHLLRTLGAELAVVASVPGEADKAIALERVCALGMALPRKDRGALTYPSFTSRGC